MQFTSNTYCLALYQVRSEWAIVTYLSWTRTLSCDGRVIAAIIYYQQGQNKVRERKKESWFINILLVRNSF